MSHLFFSLLAVTIVSVLTFALWRRTRSHGFLVGATVLYFWSLHGSWRLIHDLATGTSGASYEYLFTRMFAVELDALYEWTLAYYGLFVAVVLLTVLALVPHRRESDAAPRRPVMVQHQRLLIVALLAGIASVYLVRHEVLGALGAGVSAYAATRGTDATASLTLHQLLMRTTLFAAMLGIVSTVGGIQPRLVGALRNRWALAGYALIGVGSVLSCMLLGRKNELLFALIAGLLLHLKNAVRPRTWHLLAFGILGVVGVASVDVVRALPLDVLVGQPKFAFGEMLARPLRIGSSTEAFAAHLSLYGVMRFHVPFTLGSSLVSLAASVVPRALWPERPDDIYAYYVQEVGAAAGQGYSIHHATGWYLNFGLVGIVVGAILLGLVWSGLYRCTERFASWRSPMWRMLAAVGFCTFTASLPSLMRSGLEIYKGVLFAGGVMPVAVIGLCAIRLRTRTGMAYFAYVGAAGHCYPVITELERRPIT